MQGGPHSQSQISEEKHLGHAASNHSLYWTFSVKQTVHSKSISRCMCLLLPVKVNDTRFFRIAVFLIFLVHCYLSGPSHLFPLSWISVNMFHAFCLHNLTTSSSHLPPPWRWKQHISPKCWYPLTRLQYHNPEHQIFKVRQYQYVPPQLWNHGLQKQQSQLLQLLECQTWKLEKKSTVHHWTLNITEDLQFLYSAVC
jgi:hypothetical protein